MNNQKQIQKFNFSSSPLSNKTQYKPFNKLSLSLGFGVSLLITACGTSEQPAQIQPLGYPQNYQTPQSSYQVGTHPMLQPPVGNVYNQQSQAQNPLNPYGQSNGSAPVFVQGQIPPLGQYSSNPNSFTQRQDVADFVAQTSAKYNIPQAELFATLAKANYSEKAITLNTPKGGPGKSVKDWPTYKRNHIDSTRINAGVKFWNENGSTLSRATQTFGVPEYVIMGILGVETIYGRTMGDFRALDVLTTLAFNFPRRADFFKDELENLLVFARQNGMPAESIYSSFAGALGIPQFMPSSWRKYGVDFDGDGHVDLRNSKADAIGSIANYLKSYGWIPGEKPYFQANINAQSQVLTLLDATILPKFTPSQMASYGVTSNDSINPNSKLALIDLPYANGQVDYVLGGQNFYTVTRYNRSNMYAMSVLNLGQAVKNASGQ